MSKTTEAPTTEAVETTVTSLSPYKAAGLVNEWLESGGFEGKTIPPQMVYNYTTGQTRKGKKPFIPFHLNEAGKAQIEVEDLEAWYGKYVEGLNKKAAKASAPVEETVEAE